jgi:hypothetical protein
MGAWVGDTLTWQIAKRRNSQAFITFPSRRSSRREGDEMPVERTVDGYIESLEGLQAEVASILRDVILEAAPNSKESVKWSHSHGMFRVLPGRYPFQKVDSAFTSHSGCANGQKRPKIGSRGSKSGFPVRTAG